MKKTTKKLLSIILVAIILVAQFSFISNVMAASTEPDLGGTAYNGANPFAQSGLSGQCTWYAWGRTYELTGIDLPCRGNANTWYDVAAQNGFTVSGTPRENSVICWEGGAFADYGHVGFVEAFDGTNVTISQSNYNWSGWYDGKMTMTWDELNSWSGGGIRGYIYVGEDPKPVDTEAPNISNVAVSEKNNEGFTLTADVSDNVEVTKVSFYVTIDGQEKVFNAPSISGGKASVRINYRDYGFSSGAGKATVKVWAYDEAGLTSNTGTAELDIDLDAPILRDVKVSNVTGTVYTLTIKATDNVGIAKIQCPTWNSSENKDGLPSDWETNSKYTATEKDGVYTYKVDIKDVESKKQSGTYATLISVLDEYGNLTTYRVAVDVYPITKVTLNETEMELFKGQNFTLEAGYEPFNTTGNTKVTWKSSDEEVATVKDGVVTALKEGKTTITATIDGISETCEVTVKEIPLESVAIEEQNVQLKINEEKQLTILYNPNDTTDDKTAVWSSSDESVVKVSEDGKITGLKVGTATITVTVGEKTATTEVTVNQEVVDAENGTNASGLPKTADIQVPVLVAGMIISLAGIAYIIKRNRK